MRKRSLYFGLGVFLVFGLFSGLFMSTSARAAACDEGCAIDANCTDSSCPICLCMVQCKNCSEIGASQANCEFHPGYCVWTGVTCENVPAVPEFPKIWWAVLTVLVGGGLYRALRFLKSRAKPRS